MLQALMQAIISFSGKITIRKCTWNRRWKSANNLAWLILLRGWCKHWDKGELWRWYSPADVEVRMTVPVKLLVKVSVMVQARMVPKMYFCLLESQLLINDTQQNLFDKPSCLAWTKIFYSPLCMVTLLLKHKEYTYKDKCKIYIAGHKYLSLEDNVEYSFCLI